MGMNLQITRLRGVRGKITLSRLRYGMLFLNITACLFVMSVIAITTTNVCLYGKAEEFLRTLGRVPVNPYSSLVKTCCICLLFFVTFIIRQSVSIHKKGIIYYTFFVDAVLNIILLGVMHCNYNGFILWLLANIIFYMESNWKFLAMIAGIFIYMIFSYDLINVYVPLFSVKDYFVFYYRNVQHILFASFYMLHDLNFICFIIFCIQVIREQKDIIDEIRGLYAKLKVANEELREYADIKEKMGETKERNRLAMEIHDTIGHSLTGISVGVDTCIAIMDTNPAVAKAQLQVISGVAKTGIADIRRSVSTLQSDDSEKTSLEHNIRDMLYKAEKATGTKIEYDCSTELSFNDDEEKAIFRVIQESVTNAIRHGRATEIRIQICREQDNLKITICDNGCGCKDFKSGFGTTHMKERLAMLDGHIEFKSENGFTVNAVIPLRKEGNGQ